MKKKLVLRVALTVVAGLLSATTPSFSQEALPETAAFRGVRVTEIALSSNGRFLAVAGSKDGIDDAIGLLIVWDLMTKKETFRHRDSNGMFNSVAFSPDDKLLAAGGAGSLKGVKVWQFSSWKEVGHLEHAENASCIRFSPDGKLLGVATLVGNPQEFGVVLWDVAQYKLRASIIGPAMYFAFSPDSKHLACADLAGMAHYWNVEDGKIVKDIPVGFDPARVSFARKGNLLAAAGADGQVNLTADFTKLHRLEPTFVGKREAAIFSMLFSSDGKWLLVAGRDLSGKKVGVLGAVQVWNVAEKKLHRFLFKDLKYLVVSIAMSRDGRTLIGGCNDGVVRVWTLPNEFHRIE